LDGDYVENILFVPNSFGGLKAKDVLHEVWGQGFQQVAEHGLIMGDPGDVGAGLVTVVFLCVSSSTSRSLAGRGQCR
jgi:hypothetical protein